MNMILLLSMFQYFMRDYYGDLNVYAKELKPICYVIIKGDGKDVGSHCHR